MFELTPGKLTSNSKKAVAMPTCEHEVTMAVKEARFYDPDLGRFLQVDPARQYWNSYSYIGNIPTTNADPTGMKDYYRPQDESHTAFDFVMNDGVDDGEIWFIYDVPEQIVDGITIHAHQVAFKQGFTADDILWSARIAIHETNTAFSGGPTGYERDAIVSLVINRRDTGYNLYGLVSGIPSIKDVVTAQAHGNPNAQFSGMGHETGLSFYKYYPDGLQDHPWNVGAWNLCTQSALRVLSGHSYVNLPIDVRHYYSPVGPYENNPPGWAQGQTPYNPPGFPVNQSRFIFFRGLP